MRARAGFHSSKPGELNAAFSGQVCGGFAHEEKITMSGETTMAVVAVVTAFTFPALVSEHHSRGSAYTYQSAQYCMPQYDELSDMTRIYC
jgi:hypothetical protein